VANALFRLLRAREDRLAAFASVDWDKALGWLRQRTGAALAPEQAEAVRLALTSRVAVLTGGPGCGKSFTVRSVVELARARRAKVILVAPTGRAAKRLAELTGHEAATIHRLLQLRPGGDASFDAASPLDADLVVVDETSMVDVILANKLIKAIPPGAHLLLVGDVDQLPSVGAGEVLRDLLAAATLPVVRLTKISHAYAVTINRSQGSEYPAVVIPLTMGSYLMLRRNLLYTGVTRAKKLVVLAGSRRALAVRTKGAGRRHTALDYRLRSPEHARAALA
jgi:ATP-dependent exoDNAse (exonuclease V) alpha subunit